jgi:hypothetical protein
MAGKFIKGALVQFMETILIPLPNVIVFQFNPESIVHTWTPAQSASSATGTQGATGGNPLAVSGPPGESFSFTIQLDANDEIAEGGPVGGAIAEVSGIYSRTAALEMLLFPVPQETGGLLGAVSAALGGSDSSTEGTVTPQQVPTVLFIWGPGRILPVRVTGLTITERLYDGFLNPTFAEAQLQLKVLTPEELEKVTGPLADIAKGAYTYMTVARQALAVANLANSAESIIGMLPI